ncbi:uncharacterized protein LOC124449576 [Xenia sp. Carnegie-2017]|uniref:uncharacterized protein LOC124449576 n=1 Tax=Xenia sp. Carnegie-2017 TaxID=2897299 RepID=UPI001F03EB49|nr:uncharacterized protein LOC124449576 [Xenia sp. Carnegie-2017]
MSLKAINLLIFVAVIWCVNAEQDSERRVAEPTKVIQFKDNLHEYSKELDNGEQNVNEVHEDDSNFNATKIFLAPMPPKNACPFDCKQLCINKYGKYYRCNLKVKNCCFISCLIYKKYVKLGLKPWLCYVLTFEKICKCRGLLITKG